LTVEEEQDQGGREGREKKEDGSKEEGQSRARFAAKKTPPNKPRSRIEVYRWYSPAELVEKAN